MNTLRSHILEEVEQLDIKSLLVLKNLLSILKVSTLKSNSHLGSGAKLSRQALVNLSQELSQAVMDDREDRL